MSGLMGAGWKRSDLAVETGGLRQVVVGPSSPGVVRASTPRQPATRHGAFYRSKLSLIARRIDQHLVRWAMQKFKRLRGRTKRTWAWLAAVRQRQPMLFAHWHLIVRTEGWPVGAR